MKKSFLPTYFQPVGSNYIVLKEEVDSSETSRPYRERLRYGTSSFHPSNVSPNAVKTLVEWEEINGYFVHAVLEHVGDGTYRTVYTAPSEPPKTEELKAEFKAKEIGVEDIFNLPDADIAERLGVTVDDVKYQESQGTLMSFIEERLRLNREGR